MAPYALALAGMPCPARAADDLTRDRSAGEVETVATFDGPMPTGVTVSHSGRSLDLRGARRFLVRRTAESLVRTMAEDLTERGLIR